jgi:aminoglycoside phosphotransferase (APT) family kinase protein
VPQQFAKADRRAPDGVARRLETWFAAAFAQPDLQLRRLEQPLGAGMSSLTYLVRLEGPSFHQDLVVRQQPPAYGLFYQADLPKWARAQQALGRRLDCVPRVPFIEPDPAVLGSPFCVMQRVEGLIPPDQPPYRAAGWVCSASAAERAEMWQSAVRMLARIHAVDWQAAGLGFLRRGREGGELDAQIAYFAAFCDWAYGRRTRLVDKAVGWLRAHAPLPETLCLSWGDARPSNMVFDDGRCVAALDWELVSIGDPAQDLAWWAFSEYMFDRLLGAPAPDGCLTGSALLEAYERVAPGRLGNYRYYEVFNALRALAIYERSVAVNRAQGRDAPEGMGTGNNYVTEALEEMLGRVC